jgi:diguanylate cyclase (GGDEF)-like protein
VDAVPPAAAAERHDPEEHAVAIVRAAPGARALVETLRVRDPDLAVVALLEEDVPGAAADVGADAALVGPLHAPTAIASTCRLAARVRAQARRIAELERELAARSGGPDRALDFLKRLLLVEVRRSRRHGTPLALALVALDGWPGSAARLGARARARLLADVLATVTAAVRDIDVAVPLADGRFVVLMPHTRAEGARKVANRLCAHVRERGGAARLTASVGLAAHPGDGPVSFSALVRRASEALARAQRDGGDRAEEEASPRRRTGAAPA